MAAPIIIVKDGSLSIEIREMRNGREERIAKLKLEEIKPGEGREWILRFRGNSYEKKNDEYRFELEELTPQEVEELFGAGGQSGESSQSS